MLTACNKLLPEAELECSKDNMRDSKEYMWLGVVCGKLKSEEESKMCTLGKIAVPLI